MHLLMKVLESELCTQSEAASLSSPAGTLTHVNVSKSITTCVDTCKGKEADRHRVDAFIVLPRGAVSKKVGRQSAR